MPINSYLSPINYQQLPANSPLRQALANADQAVSSPGNGFNSPNVTDGWTNYSEFRTAFETVGPQQMGEMISQLPAGPLKNKLLAFYSKATLDKVMISLSNNSSPFNKLYQKIDADQNGELSGQEMLDAFITMEDDASFSAKDQFVRAFVLNRDALLNDITAMPAGDIKNVLLATYEVVSQGFAAAADNITISASCTDLIIAPAPDELLPGVIQDIASGELVQYVAAGVQASGGNPQIIYYNPDDPFAYYQLLYELQTGEHSDKNLQLIGHGGMNSGQQWVIIGESEEYGPAQFIANKSSLNNGSIGQNVVLWSCASRTDGITINTMLNIAQKYSTGQAGIASVKAALSNPNYLL